MNRMKIRKLKLKDCKPIWLIRNHPKARKNSLNKKRISYQEHQKWFETYLKNKDNVCYVLEENEKVLGYCRFDLADQERVVSIAIDSKLQGGGLGSYLLLHGLKRLADKKNITAKVNLNNKISLSLFQKNNFKVVKKDKNNYHLIYQSV